MAHRKRSSKRKVSYKFMCADRQNRFRTLRRPTLAAAMKLYRKAIKARWACDRPKAVVRRRGK